MCPLGIGLTGKEVSIPLNALQYSEQVKLWRNNNAIIALCTRWVCKIIYMNENMNREVCAFVTWNIFNIKHWSTYICDSSEIRSYCFSKIFTTHSQRTHDIKTMQLWRQNDPTTSFWRHNDVVFVMCPLGWVEQISMWVGVEQPTSHYLNQCSHSSLTNTCSTSGKKIKLT